MKSDRGIRVLAYLSYWYAALYVVIEGWQKLDLSNPVIDNLLKSPNVDRLKLYRHNVFHFHEPYFNIPLMAPLIESEDAPVDWVRQLGDEFSRWFLEWANQRGETPDADAT